MVIALHPSNEDEKFGYIKGGKLYATIIGEPLGKLFDQLLLIILSDALYEAVLIELLKLSGLL